MIHSHVRLNHICIHQHTQQDNKPALSTTLCPLPGAAQLNPPGWSEALTLEVVCLQAYFHKCLLYNLSVFESAGLSDL